MRMLAVEGFDSFMPSWRVFLCRKLVQNWCIWCIIQRCGTRRFSSTPAKSSLLVLCFLFLLAHRLHGGEEQHITNRRAVGHQHDHTVQAEAQAARGGHTVLEGVDEVLVDLGVDALGLAGSDLLLEAAALVDGVVQLGEGVAELAAVNEEFEALGQVLVLGLALGQGRDVSKAVKSRVCG